MNINSLDRLSREEALDELRYLISVDYYNKSPIVEIPNFVSDNKCDEIRHKIKEHIKNNPEEIYEGTVRHGKSLTISQNSKLVDVDNFLFENFSSKIFVDVLKDHPYYSHFVELLKNQVSDNGYDFHSYYDQEYCKQHADNVFHHPGRTKDFLESVFIFASCSLCLNTPKEGGEIVFPHLNKKIKSEKGKVVIWSPHPFYEHYTNPTPNDFRDVIITWMLWSDKVVIDNKYYDQLLKNQNNFSGGVQ